MRRTALTLLASLCLLAGCGGDDGGDSADTSASPPSAETPKGGCRQVTTPEAKPDGGQERPRGKLKAGAVYEVTFATSCGDFVIRVDQKTSPATAASFVSLARKGFFDDTVFHRIVPGFVIQGGDPTASGTGGPGYSTVDKPPAGARYTRGVVAMAKAPNEPPGAAGSQFYVVTGDDAGLPPEYALLGKVVKGLKVTAAIDALGDPAAGDAGSPTQTVLIEKATVEEK